LGSRCFLEVADEGSSGEGICGMRILFVCYGNICRSPMAKGLAHKMLGRLAEVESAGTGAIDGRSASANAIEIMRSRFEVDLSEHRSRNVRDVRLDDFDYIVPMDDSVAEDLKAMYPRINAKVMQSWRIDDPIGKGPEAYIGSAKEIQIRLRELSAYLRDKFPHAS
jgi:protein-tyrosine-phosphatase